MDNNNWLQQILMFGIGTTSLVADRVREVSEQWVKDGKIDSDQAKSFVDDLMGQMKLDPAMDELRGRIDRLERQVRELENKLWK
jgi:polyhydroxyalkanoate synthesis regulator phasin